MEEVKSNTSSFFTQNMHTLHGNTPQNSKITALDLMDFRPEEAWVSFDLSVLLYEGVIVKEKQFKSALNKVDLEMFKGKSVVVQYDKNLILPSWIFMAITSRLLEQAKEVSFENETNLKLQGWLKQLEKTNFAHLKDERVVIIARPGIPPEVYAKITSILSPLVKALMYGEVGLPKVIWKRK